MSFNNSFDSKYSHFQSQCSSNDFTSQKISQDDTSKRDVRQEMIQYFYSSMLQYIIEKKEIKINTSVESIPSAERVLVPQSYKEFEKHKETEQHNEHDAPILWEEAESRSIKSLQTPVKRRKKTIVLRRQDRSSKLSGLKIKASLTTATIPFSWRKKSSCTFPDRWMLDHTEENVKIKFLNGNRYEGTTFCNMLHGQGKYTWTNGAVYEGEFKNNEITGRGRFQFPDQTIYTGEVYKQYCHGAGLLFPSKSPCIYKGNFHLNVKQGLGWQLFSDNNTYEGEWMDDHMNGEGRRKYPSGAEYYGKYAMGKRHGYGIAVLKNHDVYAGEWVQGVRDGFGDYIWNVQNEHYFAVPVQNFYYGSWVDNKRDGIGVINFGMEGGSRYAGYFSNNEKHGSGVIICNNGHVIESSPLFIKDKPVHVTDTGNLQLVNSTVDLSIKEEETPRSPNVTQVEFTNGTTREEILLRKFPLADKLPFATSSFEEQSSVYTFINPKQNKDSSDVYNNTFPKIIDQYSSLKIPIGVPCEHIDLNTHIYKIIEFKSRMPKCHKIKDNNESCTSSVETYSDYELYKFEEVLIRKSISKYLKQLKGIYNQYAKIGCIEKITTFKPWLMRLFFWQLYRDCKITEKGISLIDIDLMFSEKSTFDGYVVHNPFETIYFWQYLESLLHIALELYGEEFLYSEDGILKQSFECLMENDILPNAGHFRGSALFEYKDVLPMKAAYAWYKSFGEPHSVKDFLGNIFKKEKRKHLEHDDKEVLDLPYIQTGRNVINCGNKIFYFEDDDCVISNKSIPSKIKSMQHEDPDKLHFLANLKPDRIIKNIIAICPCLKDKKNINNVDYKLSFLEFYEIILLCIQEKINLQKNHPKLSVLPISIKKTQFLKKHRTFSRKSKKAQG